MRYVEAGGVKISAIGHGTWQYGSREWGYGSDYANKTALDITRRALDLGINLIDTAEIYGFGRSERIVGQAIAGRRDEAFLATKVFPVLPLAAVVRDRGRRSAGRLQTDHIDLYQVHWPNPLVPLSQTMGGVKMLHDEGVVRHAGVSNFDLPRWQAAERAYGGPVLSNQVQYSLVKRGPEAQLIPWAQHQDRVIIAYSPLAQGFLSAKYDESNAPGGVRAGNAMFVPENLRRARELLDALRDVAKTHGATAAQVALAWVIRRPNVVAIPGASSVAQLEANAAAADLDLTDAEDAAITGAADRFEPLPAGSAVPQMLRARLRR